VAVAWMVDLLRDFLSSYLKAQHFAFCDPKDPTLQEQSKASNSLVLILM
jgi:hypothetical protein